jgi:DNA-binding transcriptional LysR family regulator
LQFDLLKALEMFVCVAESGSMTAAAERLRITPSAISQQMKQLETELGGSLLDRGTRPLRLTRAGTSLRQRATLLLAEAEQARAAVRDAVSGHVPDLRIAFLSTFARPLVPAMMSLAQRPDIAITHVSILRGMAINHTRELLAREVDIIVTSDALDDVENLERHDLVRERFLLVMPPDESDTTADLAALAARLPLLRYTTRTRAGLMIERHFRRLRLQIPAAHYFEAPEDLLRMVSAGLGWSVATPSQLAPAIAAQLPLHIMPLPRPGISRAITLVARQGELGELPALLARHFRHVLRTDHLPRIRQGIPDMPSHFEIVED